MELGKKIIPTKLEYKCFLHVVTYNWVLSVILSVNMLQTTDPERLSNKEDSSGATLISLTREIEWILLVDYCSV
jgi:hypothetical protein